MSNTTINKWSPLNYLSMKPGEPPALGPDSGLIDAQATNQILERLALATWKAYWAERIAKGYDWGSETDEEQEIQVILVYYENLDGALKAMGCEIRPLTDSDAASFRFTPREVEQLARLEHERWCDERCAEGWTYSAGPRNRMRRTHPSLVAWEALPESEREKNRNMIRSLPRFLANLGFQISRIGHSQLPQARDEKLGSA